MIQALTSNAITSLKSFGLTLKEGAEAAKSTGSDTASTMPIDTSGMQRIIISVSFIIALVMITLFNNKVGDKLETKEKFNGIAWGIGTSIFLVNIILAIYMIIVVISLYKKIARIKDKKYAKYAKSEMAKFLITYCLCVLIGIVIAIYVFQVR